MCISQSVILLGFYSQSPQVESNHLTTNVNYSSISLEFKANTSGMNARMLITKANAQSEFLKTVNTSKTIKQTRNTNNPHISNHQLSKSVYILNNFNIISTPCKNKVSNMFCIFINPDIKF